MRKSSGRKAPWACISPEQRQAGYCLEGYMGEVRLVHGDRVLATWVNAPEDFLRAEIARLIAEDIRKGE